jgi:hypothetical protein
MCDSNRPAPEPAPDLAAQALALAAKATPGPWRNYRKRRDGPFSTVWAKIGFVDIKVAACLGGMTRYGDAKFIAAARELVPALARRVQELESRNSELRMALSMGTAIKLAEGSLIVLDRVRHLEEVLEAVEWMPAPGSVIRCPWCGNERQQGHAPDCARQGGLGVDGA